MCSTARDEINNTCRICPQMCHAVRSYQAICCNEKSFMWRLTIFFGWVCGARRTGIIKACLRLICRSRFSKAMHALETASDDDNKKIISIGKGRESSGTIAPSNSTNVCSSNDRVLNCRSFSSSSIENNSTFAPIVWVICSDLRAIVLQAITIAKRNCTCSYRVLVW